MLQNFCESSSHLLTMMMQLQLADDREPRVMPKQTLLKKAVSEKAISEKDVSEKNVSEKAVLEISSEISSGEKVCQVRTADFCRHSPS